jgi:uncharacterized protein (TIGR03083 family)
MSDHHSFGELYVDAQRSFATLAATLTPHEWATPVPCCPGWTVRDVLSHVVGLTDDVLAGNVEGAASEPWTAAQVERLRDVPVAELLSRWDSQAAAAGALFDAIGEGRPPFDCCSHEHDVRHAIGRPGNRDSVVVAAGAASVGRGITVPDGLSDFELFRSRLGRRSADQVRAYAWAQPPDDVQLSGWFIFGPSPVDIDE